MRGGSILLVTATLGWACTRQGSVETSQPPLPTATLPAPPAAPPSDAGAAAPTPLTDDQRKKLRAHIQSGQNHSEAKEWAPAVAEFDAALKIAPDDATALNELSFVALQAGDVAKAKKAGSAALNRATEPRLKAAALYNLGRIAEREGDDQVARSYYEQSEAVRPNQEVYKRRVGLADPSRKPQPEELPCTQAQPLSAICSCLRKQRPEWLFYTDGSTAAMDCGSVDTVQHPRARLISLTKGVETVFLVVARTGPGWGVIGKLFREMRKDSLELLLQQDSVAIQDRKLGAAQLLWIKYSYRHSSGNGEEAVDDTFQMVAVCVLAGAPGKPRCPLNAPLAHSGSYTQWTQPDSGGKTKNRSFSSRYRIDLTPDGAATVVQVENSKDDYFDDKELGPWPLW